jgi:hypothetical protein
MIDSFLDDTKSRTWRLLRLLAPIEVDPLSAVFPASCTNASLAS